MAERIQLQQPGKGEVRVSEATLKKIIGSEAFYTKQFTREGREFFYFHEYGDYLKGQLLSKHSNAHIGRSASYRIRVEAMRRDGSDVKIDGDDHIEEFFGNKQLQRVLDKNELIGSIVRIVYIGRAKTKFSHSAKVYDVFKITGISREQETKQDGSKRKYKKRARSRTK